LPYYRDNSEVDIRAEAAVKPYLLLAKEAASFERRIVEVAQVYRLLDFIGVIAGEEDQGHLRLCQLDFLGGIG